MAYWEETWNKVETHNTETILLKPRNLVDDTNNQFDLSKDIPSKCFNVILYKEVEKCKRLIVIARNLVSKLYLAFEKWQFAWMILQISSFGVPKLLQGNV